MTRRITKVRPPRNFVSLHSHSGFSTFDGLDYPQEHIDFVIKNNEGKENSAWALTDHGHMNGFAHAFLHAEKRNKENGTNFKFIPGCEMYVHPDLQLWNLQNEFAKVAKKEDTYMIQKLEMQAERMGYPPLGKGLNEDDESDSGIEDAGLTVENEEASKRSKYYDPRKRRHHLVVLPKTSLGLQRLFSLVSKGYIDGFYRFPRVDYNMLREAAFDENGESHLIISSACIGGPLAYEVLSRFQDTEFEDLVPSLLDDEAKWQEIHDAIDTTYKQLVHAVGKENVFLELQFNKLSAQHLVNRALIQYAEQHMLRKQLVVTCDSHYSSPDKWKAREMYKKLGWLGFEGITPDALPKSIDDLKCELYPKNEIQVWDSYLDTTGQYDFYNDKDIVKAIERSYEIAFEKIGEVHPDTSVKLPSYVIPEGESANKALIRLSKEGLIAKGLHVKPDYVERMKEELRVILEKNFAQYFLTMKKIVDIAKRKMSVGPGRGSGAGSLVNYCLGITNVDPIKYGLFFSRFLDPTRKDLPDIDTDFADRDQLIKMLHEEFGSENVIPISNYNRFQLKSLVKDISRFYGLDFAEVNKALGPLDFDVKQGLREDRIETNGPVQIDLAMAKKYSPKFLQFLTDHPEIEEHIDDLHKQNKALGRHAGGVIVSEDIANRMPLILARGELQTPWVEGASYKHLEEFGWVKFDLLGLGTLRIIDRAIELILQRKEGIKRPTFDEISEWFENNMGNDVLDWNDPKAYEVYEQGRWAGVFQCTNDGAQKLFMRAKPKSILDIAALTSIYRPGPLAMNIDKKYVKRKNDPDSIRYDHPILEEILGETYGCLVFQEQTMAIVNRLGRIPLEECNSIRKMMKPQQSSADAKKKAKALKDRIMAGFAESGLRRDQAEALYSDIMQFTAYSFNKSHAVSYAMVSYYCAWMLTYYEEEWLCAYLETMQGHDSKKMKAAAEIRGLGYTFEKVDVNYADHSWTILPGKKFMPSFSSVKGVGDIAVDELIRIRTKLREQNGVGITSIEELLFDENGKWQVSKFNKKAMDSLIKVKAFGSTGMVGDGKTFDNYKHMELSLIGKWSSWKKKLKSDPRKGYNDMLESIELNRGCEPYSRAEIITNEVKLLGSVSVDTVIPPRYIHRFSDEGWHNIDEYAGETTPHWFIIAQAMPKKTRNGGKYLRCKAIGESGKNYWLNVWSWNGKEMLPPYTVCVAMMKRNQFGLSTNWKKLEIFVE
jgi:DNA-directed DNA polymerase III PolC